MLVIMQIHYLNFDYFGAHQPCGCRIIVLLLLKRERFIFEKIDKKKMCYNLSVIVCHVITCSCILVVFFSLFFLLFFLSVLAVLDIRVVNLKGGKMKIKLVLSVATLKKLLLRLPKL